jgi:hypothetical protein
MKRVRRCLLSALIALAVSAVAGCRVARDVEVDGRVTTTTVSVCRAGETQMQRSTLYFGAAYPHANDFVNDGEWLGFLADTVTPRFPDGLTWFNANGQWRGANGNMIGEHSRVIVLMHADTAEIHTAISEIRSTYKSRFEQESTLHERAMVCVSF